MHIDKGPCRQITAQFGPTVRIGGDVIQQLAWHGQLLQLGALPIQHQGQTTSTKTSMLRLMGVRAGSSRARPGTTQRAA